MLQIIHFKNDIKQIMRDPIMAIMMVAPLFMILVFKLLVIFLTPFIITQTEFDITPYFQYVLAFVLLINSSMLGIVTGFMMLDERDGNITELMSVTPLGRSGYLINRLSFASILSFIYCIVSCSVLNLAGLPLISVLFLSILSAIYSAIIGLLIFSSADDKVKGLTIAKALNALILFAFADLFCLNWLTVLSWLFPPYWITMIVKSPYSLLASGIALFVHVGWLWILILRYWRKRT
jgi:fluoroquinolone transport system permease protein